MSRSYWLPVFVAIGWLTLWSQNPRAQGVPSPSPSPEEQSDKSTQGSADGPSGLPVIILETPEQTQAREKAEAESREHEAKDLEAQVRAADAGEKGAAAAEWQIIPTWLGAILSFIGTVLILITLKLARDANKIAQETAERQLRAYVLINSVRVSIDPQSEDRFGATVDAKNFGLTPAKSVVEWAMIEVAAVPLDKTLEKPAMEYGGVSTLAPSQHSVQIPTMPKLTEVMTRSIMDGHTAIYVFGGITYADAFGRSRKTSYRFMCTGQGLALGLFRQCPEGNEYT